MGTKGGKNFFIHQLLIFPIGWFSDHPYENQPFNRVFAVFGAKSAHFEVYCLNCTL
jgi:hypothetical protein